MITNTRESYILNCDNDFLNELNIKRWWTDELSNQTKDAIWQYMNTLIVLGTTISRQILYF